MHMAPLGLALIAGLAAHQDPAQQPKEIHVKVVMATRVHMVQRDENGLISTRRGFMEDIQKASINEAIKSAKAAVEAETGVVVSYDTLFDDEPYFVWFDKDRLWVNDMTKPMERSAQDGQLLGKPFAEDVIGPWLNEQGFAGQVSPNYGPFQAGVIIHAGLTDERTNLTIRNTPIRVFSYTNFSQQDPIPALAQELADAATSNAGLARVEIPAPMNDVFGEFKAEQFNDPQNGTGQRISNLGIVTRGGVVVASGVDQRGYLTLKMRTKTTAPFSIVGVDEKMKPLGAALLGRSVVKPVEQEAIPTAVYSLPPDNKWHNVSIPLSDLGGNPAKIMVAYHPYARFVEYEFKDRPIIDVAMVEFKSAAEKDSLPRTDFSATSPASSGNLIDDLKSQNSEIRLGAGWKLVTEKDAASVPLLIEMAKSANPLDAMVAMPALANQDTPDAWAALRTQMVRGPFDANRRFAAMVLTGKLTNADVLDASPALAVRSWRTRLAVLNALIPVNTREASFIYGASLEDPYPQIRMRVAENLILSEKLLLRRMLFAAVNDPSQYVRLAIYLRLIDVEDEETRAEALKGVRDDALGVRLGLINHMKADPKPHYRAALQLAILDTDPTVRVATLEAFSAQPDRTQPGEIRSAFTDEHESVQLSLVNMARANRVNLPADVIEALKNSPHQSVRDAAKDLS